MGQDWLRTGCHTVRNRQVAEAKSSLGSTTFFGNAWWLPPDPPENEDVLLPKATKFDEDDDGDDIMDEICEGVDGLQFTNLEESGT